MSDEEGVVWTCIQAFAGLANDPEKQEAARLARSDRIAVVCTERRRPLPALGPPGGLGRNG